MKRGKLFKYTEKQMEDAISACTSENNPMSKNEAAKKFQVPRSTLQDKLAGRSQLGRKMGKDLYLSSEEEQDIVEYPVNN